jgi:predicted esterase
MHILGTKYEGDTISVKVRRGQEERSFTGLSLTGVLTSFARAFLGILPVRDDPVPGVEVRYVYTSSPAARAGIQAGDRILGISASGKNAQKISGRTHLAALLGMLVPGSEVRLSVKKKGKEHPEDISLQTASPPDDIPDELLEAASRGQALHAQPASQSGKPENKDKTNSEQEKTNSRKGKQQKAKASTTAETGLLRRSNTAGDQEYWLFVPENYDPNISHALVIWLHPSGRAAAKDAETMVEAWQSFCSRDHIILMGPRAENETGWLAGEADIIAQTVRQVMAQYTIDPERIVAHGMGTGGQMAFYLGFHARDLIRGVTAIDAVLGSDPPESQPAQPLSFYLVAGRQASIAQALREYKSKLVEKRFPLVYRELELENDLYLTRAALAELVRWIDSLDRL